MEALLVGELFGKAHYVSVIYDVMKKVMQCYVPLQPCPLGIHVHTHVKQPLSSGTNRRERFDWPNYKAPLSKPWHARFPLYAKVARPFTLRQLSKPAQRPSPLSKQAIINPLHA